MNNISDKFEAWYQTQFSEIVDFSLFAPTSAYYKDDDIDEAWDVWQAATEQSQKEIAEKDELLDEQKCAIKGLNMCIGGEDSLTTNNLRACGEYLDNEKCLLEMVRELQAREKVLVEAISSSLNCIREEINLNNYTETLLGDFISYYGDMVIILQYALANVRGEVK